MELCKDLAKSHFMAREERLSDSKERGAERQIRGSLEREDAHSEAMSNIPLCWRTIQQEAFRKIFFGNH